MEVVYSHVIQDQTICVAMVNVILKVDAQRDSQLLTVHVDVVVNVVEQTIVHYKLYF